LGVTTESVPRTAGAADVDVIDIAVIRALLRLRGGNARRRLRMALDLAAAAGQAIAGWMLWIGWCAHVGCDECFAHGPSAPCWGKAECHGFASGCGCLPCIERQVTATQEVRPA
jgi:hypothetical protein